jgi:hypothetical protein
MTLLVSPMPFVLWEGGEAGSRSCLGGRRLCDAHNSSIAAGHGRPVDATTATGGHPVSTPERDSGCRLAVKTSCVNLVSEIADVGVRSSALRSDRAVRPSGDGGAEHPLCGGCVGHGARRSRDRHQDMLLQAAVAGRVVGGAGLPAAPYHAAPGAAEGASGAGMVVAASDGAGVVVGGPGVVVAAAVGERVEGVAQPLVACPTEAGDLCVCRIRARPRPGRRRRRVRRAWGSARGSRRSRPASWLR